jgi:hypothetical protein
MNFREGETMISTFVVAIGAFLCGLLTRIFLFEREYKEQDGHLVVRHGKLGKWMLLDRHFQEHDMQG